MDACPRCGSKRIHRSRTKFVLERYRRLFTHKRPFRCHECDWRGWGEETIEPITPVHAEAAKGAAPDLAAIDRALDKSDDEPA